MVPTFPPQASETATFTDAPVAFDPAYESAAARKASRVGTSWKHRAGQRSSEEERDADQLQRAQLRAARVAVASVYSVGANAEIVRRLVAECGRRDKGFAHRHYSAMADCLQRALATNLMAALSEIPPHLMNAGSEWRAKDTADTRRALTMAVLELYGNPESGKNLPPSGTWTEAGADNATARKRNHDAAVARIKREEKREREHKIRMRKLTE